MALRIEAILSGLRVSGYAAPAQVEIVGRAAEGDPARIVPLVAEVIAKNVSVIMASGPLALKRGSIGYAQHSHCRSRF